MANQPAAGNRSRMQFPDQQPPPVFVAPAKSKIFVGSLAWGTKSEALQRYFEQFGEIMEAVVIIDKHTGRSKGYGFVTFADAEAAKLACANPNPVIDSRKANCNLALTSRTAPVRPNGNLGPPYWRTPQSLKAPYLGNSMYQLPFSYGYQPGLLFPMYRRCRPVLRYPAYGPEYLYPQIYGVPVTASPKGMLSGQFANPPTTNFPSTAVKNYVTPGPHLVQYGKPIIRAVTPEVTPMQTPHYSGLSVQAPAMQQLTPTSPPQFVPGNGSEQMAA